MSAARIWEDEWSPSEEFGRHLDLVVATPRPLRTGVAVSRRRAVRARMLRRRRRAAIGVGVIVTTVILAWPGHAFGGVTGSGVIADQSNGTMLASGMVYVVHSGDTVNSIAQLVNPYNVAAARHALVSELGSSVVVPGEHVLIP